jgi:hypothetical protein
MLTILSLIAPCSYDEPYDPKQPVLKTCNPARAIAVSHSLSPQPVSKGTEVIFSYDVKFTVRKLCI